ncbi:MAG: M20 family metallopeptidase [Acidobacteriaceae bacterium]|nr:M20 family metallopeptidase [Acidobacteriaceae bacterium]
MSQEVSRGESPATLLRLAVALERRLIERIRVLVEMESPSQDKSAVDRVTKVVAQWAQEAGANVRMYPNPKYGASLEARFGDATSEEKPVLLLGHLDTVWDTGTLKSMPWREDEHTLSGPGVLDMKAGVVMALTALEILQRARVRHHPVILLVHADEEIGSLASRPLTEKVASECRSVFVLEPAQGEEAAYKTARKGVGHFQLEIEGVASHAGVDFATGHSAVVELARQLIDLAAMSDLKRGLTVNPGVITGGSRSNVVAADASVEIDVRVESMEDADAVQKKLTSLSCYDKNCTLRLLGEINRPPMVRTPAIAALFERASSYARAMQLEPLHEASTGGGSDGNFTAALGVPTLDGMGAVGAGAHAAHEHLLKRYLAPRTALIAAMLLRDEES